MIFHPHDKFPCHLVSIKSRYKAYYHSSSLNLLSGSTPMDHHHRIHSTPERIYVIKVHSIVSYRILHSQNNQKVKEEKKKKKNRDAIFHGPGYNYVTCVKKHLSHTLDRRSIPYQIQIDSDRWNVISYYPSYIMILFLSPALTLNKGREIKTIYMYNMSSVLG